MNSSVVERWAENSEVVGSNPTLNTMVLFLLFIIYYYSLVELIYTFSLNYINFSSESSVILSSYIYIILIAFFFFKKKIINETTSPATLRYYIYSRYIKLLLLKSSYKLVLTINLFLKNFFLKVYKNNLDNLNFFKKLIIFLQKTNLLWRPLFKRWSYFGLFSKTRTFWIRK